MKVSEKYNNQEYLKNVILFKKKKKILPYFVNMYT